MRKNSLFLSLLAVLAVMMGCNSNEKSGVEVITARDIDVEADLTEIAYDFRIHPLKCDGPLDGIGGIKS